ncbi:MAG: DUF4175 domain-containing protein, partial [Rhodospirillales bacterium]|nr:DUF4175 domain-containing protein [Rhodospirillales bacterium]
MARKKGWLKERIRRRLWQARAALLWESLWPGLWPLLALAGLFLGLALLDVLPGLAGWFHAGILVAFAVGGLALLGLLLRGLRLPDRAAARRRLERDSDLSHRPLEVLEDHRAGSVDPLGEALWAMHRRRMAARLPNLKLPRPRPQIAALDPLALRAPVLLLLVVALVVGHRDALARIDRALSPHLQDGSAQSLLLQVWVTPPAYTGVAPILLQFPGDRPAETPRVPS